VNTSITIRTDLEVTVEYHQFNSKIIFMEAIPLCLLLNKTHLFSLTQHTFILSI